ncbi:FG-GAP and VCBS repeat-containing protein [Streptomyces sp. NPDC088350]|uniref:FG-GAP and VCBS repeat-containing protein n=1 Tax=Streptomyces sp. NPDC088350 TaxID=3365854 RepID=UPI0038236B0B
MFRRRTSRIALATAVTAALTGGMVVLSGSAASAAPPAKHADDFNGDGYRDYVVGDSGSFTVTYGTASGPGSTSRTITQNSPGIPGKSGDAGGYVDTFGESLATADFNRDGYADLAVADKTEKVGSRAAQGTVTIVWGSRSGLSSSATRLPLRAPHADYEFGWSIAAGDFNGDGKPDLAVSDIEKVYVYRGGFSKSGTTGKVTTHRPKPSVTHVFEPTGLVAGKVTKDKATDLYVLGQGEKNDRMTQAAWFLRGGSTVKAGTFTTYDTTAPDWSPTGVIADFDKNGYGDLAVSDTPYNKHAGSVVVLRGGAKGAASSYRLSQSTAGVATAAAKDEQFGFSVSAGDTDHDGYPDLAVGVPFEKVGSAKEAGGVHVLHGGPHGLTGTGSEWFTRESGDVPGKAVSDAAFGVHVRLRDVDRDGYADLLVSDQYTDYDTSVLLPAGPAGVSASGVRELPVRADFPQ